ncbi:MAG TPA: DUF58 domain-containing protein [Acidimicrobiales bacterium]|nr:DUF58 domain-containing protein [Acidimicrobiales bacterium]
MSSGTERAARRWGRAGSPRAPASPPSTDPATLATKAAVLRRLELDVTRRLDGMLSGDYLAFAAGPGTEPAGARPYGPGDDARRIDWNLTARALSTHVRTTEADRELETWVVVDRSASLDFGTAQREKREVALAAVAAFGFLTVRAGNRFGVLIAGGDQLIRLPSRNGRIGVLTALSALYDTPRRETGPALGADLAAALTRLERTQLRRGQVIVVSDFLDTSDWAAPLRRLGLRHQMVAAQVTDPRELQLPAVGMLAVVDTETGRHLHIQTNSAAIRDRFAAAAGQRHDRIRRSLTDAGAECLQLSTDRDWLVDVVRFVGRRRRERVPNRVTGRGGYPTRAGQRPGSR